MDTRNEALQWWATLDYDERLVIVTQHCPGIELELVNSSISKIEAIYLKIYYPEGVE